MAAYEPAYAENLERQDNLSDSRAPGARQDCGGLGDGFPVVIPFVVGPETHKSSHGSYVIDIPPHPRAFHTLTKLFAEALHRAAGNRVAFAFVSGIRQAVRIFVQVSAQLFNSLLAIGFCIVGMS